VFGEGRYELSNIIDETIERLDFMWVMGCGPIQDLLNLSGTDFEALRRDDMAEELDFIHEQAGLPDRYDNTGFAKFFKDEADVSAMFFEGIREDDDVINVDITDVTYILSEGPIHETLPGGDSVT
jgi:hypothetical protein